MCVCAWCVVFCCCEGTAEGTAGRRGTSRSAPHGTADGARARACMRGCRRQKTGGSSPLAAHRRALIVTASARAAGLISVSVSVSIVSTPPRRRRARCQSRGRTPAPAPKGTRPWARRRGPTRRRRRAPRGRLRVDGRRGVGRRFKLVGWFSRRGRCFCACFPLSTPASPLWAASPPTLPHPQTAPQISPRLYPLPPPHAS